MPNPLLLERLLNAPALARIVPHLQPAILHRVVESCGLEDCAELIALTTPAQLAGVLDLDLWRPGRTGDGEFDADRFGVWLEVLMQSGAEVAAQKLAGLDIELVIAGIARHAAVFDSAAVSPYTTLDGEQAPGRMLDGELVAEVGGYVIAARRTSAWEALVDLLVFLDSDRPDYFRRLMGRCVRLSNGTREADGFHDLLDDREQEMFDLASDRDERQERQGYATPAQARAFLQSARQLDLGGSQLPLDPLALAYFRAIEPASPVEDLSHASGDSWYVPQTDGVPPVEHEAMAAVVEVLRDAGVIPLPPRALLASNDAEPPRLASIRTYVDSHAASVQELAYLANTMMAGCSIQGRPFTPREASDAVAAICNLGLESWPDGWQNRELVTAFQVGWAVLHHDVCVFTTARLIETIGSVRCRDRETRMRLVALRRELVRQTLDRAPWQARNALDVIMTLDTPAWAALLGLTSECPVISAALSRSRQPLRTIQPDDFEFISTRSQLAIVRAFVASLPSRLGSPEGQRLPESSRAQSHSTIRSRPRAR
jgi:Family of unknown function (DUF6178)